MASTLSNFLTERPLLCLVLAAAFTLCWIFDL